MTVGGITLGQLGRFYDFTIRARDLRFTPIEIGGTRGLRGLSDARELVFSFFFPRRSSVIFCFPCFIILILILILILF